MARTFSVALAAALLALGCSDWLVVPPLNSPSPGGDPITTAQVLASGILFQNRTTFSDYISDVGIFGRESFNYFPTDGRTQGHYVAQNPLDAAGFTNGGWTPRYRNRRNIQTLLDLLNGTTAFPVARVAAARGFAKTMDALELSYITAQRHDYGATVDVMPDPKVLAPFVSRDSVENFIIARLDDARTDLLAAGGEPFPFTLTAGFTTNGSFDTPVNFLQFNRAIYARVQAWRAALGNPACGAPPGAACYSAALTALTEAGVDTTASLGRGVYHVYSTASGDALDALNAAVNKDFLAHPSVEPDAPLDTLGQPDGRYRAKIRTLSAPRCPVGGAGTAGICTSLGFQIYPTTTSPAPIFRNEELILLQAEALYFTGDDAGALADINFIRRHSGGLAARGAFVDANDFTTELLLQRRYSLLWEGHRWVDVRRFGRITTLPLDAPSHFRQIEQPVPQAECLQREAYTSGPLHCPAPVPVP